MAHEWEDDFDDIVSSLSNLVGENEIEARKIMGDANYDKLMDHLDRTSELAIKKDEAQIQYLSVLSALHGTIGVSLIFACVMGLAWSVYTWVN